MTSVADFTGARGSNAGDQFHELWALQQILSLVEPSTDLRAVTVEGVRATSAVTGADWEAVDCALFFGGDRLETAYRVEIIQLKYSGDPTSPWTIARLCYSSGTTVNNSVLRKLAKTYQAAVEQAKLGTEIQLRFVSNQPADAVLTRAIAAVRSGQPARTALGESYSPVARAIDLTGEQLTQFLRSLDFSECGGESRFVHRERTILAVARLIEGNAASVVSELRQRVNELMLPERRREVVTRETVLSWFYVHDMAALFPCPPNPVELNNPTIRAATKELAILLEAGTKLVVVHGPAGCGKTTVLGQLERLLPHGSSVVLFDCYGAGRYLATNHKRHLPDNAFLQLGNDLAVGTNTPFFLAREGKRPANVIQFIQRLSDVGATVADEQPDALLVVSIDAADNAVTASERAVPAERCFVHDLTGAFLDDLPANVRLVISARSARLDGLRLPPDTAAVVCSEFTRDETGGYIHSFWPNASKHWVDQFHHLSNGIPRVQAYAIEAAGEDQNEVLNVLRPGGKSLSDVLRHQFDEAAKKHGVQDSFDRLTAGLALLPPPIPAATLAAAVGAPVDVVVDVVHDLSPGLSFDRETEEVSVSDEDFEDFIKRSAETAWGSVRTAATQHLFDNHRSNPYAATHLADFLLEAGRAEDLLRLIEDDESLKVIADPIVRREVQLRRLRIALRACRSRPDMTDTLKTIVISADASKSEDALRDVLERETDLAVHFARSSLRRLVLADRDRAAHQGSVLAHDAARAARAGDLITTRELLVSHDAWLHQRNALSKEERWSWTVSTEDLVARAVAVLAVSDAKTVYADLMRWQPQTLPLQVGLKLIPALIAAGEQETVVAALEQGILAAPWDLILAVPLALSGCTVPVAQLENSLRALSRRHLPAKSFTRLSSSRDSWEQPLLDLLLTACELAAHLGGDHQSILRALVLLRSATYPTGSSFSAEYADALIRIWLLERHLTQDSAAADSLINWLAPSGEPSEIGPANPLSARGSSRLGGVPSSGVSPTTARFPVSYAADTSN